MMSLHVHNSVERFVHLTTEIVKGSIPLSIERRESPIQKRFCNLSSFEGNYCYHEKSRCLSEFKVYKDTEYYTLFSPKIRQLIKQTASFGMEAIMRAKPYVTQEDLLQVGVYVEQLFYKRFQKKDPEIHMKIFIQCQSRDYYWEGPISETWYQAQLVFDLYNKMLSKIDQFDQKSQKEQITKNISKED